REQGSAPPDKHFFDGGSDCALLILPHRRRTRQAERRLQKRIPSDLAATTCHCLTAPRVIGLPTLEKVIDRRKRFQAAYGTSAHVLLNDLVTIGRERERSRDIGGVCQRLLHPCAGCMHLVFGFNS